MAFVLASAASSLPAMPFFLEEAEDKESCLKKRSVLKLLVKIH